MNVTTKIKVDLAEPILVDNVEAVQGDCQTRCIQVSLLENGNPWSVPESAEVAVAYTKQDRTKGLYNKLADGSDAITVNGSTVTMVMAGQMLTNSGNVRVALVFHDKLLNRLTSFPFNIHVRKSEFAGQEPSKDYIRLQWLDDKLEELLAALKASGEFDGAPGMDGYTPVRGTDYWTEEDIAQIRSYVDDAILGGAW